MNPRSKAPTGRPHTSLGQRPRVRATPDSPALKGRAIRGAETCPPERRLWAAPTGLELFNTADPGRCPGLGWNCPVGAQEGATA